MASVQDASLGFSAESTYKTYVAPTRFVEVLGDESLQVNKYPKQGVGLRVGGRVARSTRRYVPTADASGDFGVELASKGIGLLFKHAMGSTTHTLVGGTTYQSVHTIGDAFLPLTLQKGIPRVDGTVDAYTFLGAVITALELSFGQGEIAGAKFSVDAGDYSVAQSYVTPTYPTAPSLFHFGGASVSIGTVTPATSTALASATTPLTNVRSLSAALNHNAKTDRWNMLGTGRKSQPTPGLREITGSFEADYDAIALRDLILGDTATGIVMTVSGGALSTGLETFQVVIPSIRLESGGLPNMNGTDLTGQSITFTGLDDLTNPPIQIVQRTSDATL